MDKDFVIRNERESDYEKVEQVVRRAFWNLYVPGCTEHYLVRILRSHADYLPALSFVAELDGGVIGSIHYTKNHLIDEAGLEKEILTFGPLCIAPEYQRKGYGKRLIEHSFEKAAALGYDTVVIFGDPGNYVSRGFICCRKCGVSLSDGSYPTGMMVKELKAGALAGHRWIYRQSGAYDFSEEEAARYDETLEPWEKKVLPCQEEFYIISHSVIGRTGD